MSEPKPLTSKELAEKYPDDATVQILRLIEQLMEDVKSAKVHIREVDNRVLQVEDTIQKVSARIVEVLQKPQR